MASKSSDGASLPLGDSNEVWWADRGDGRTERGDGSPGADDLSESTGEGANTTTSPPNTAAASELENEVIEGRRPSSSGVEHIDEGDEKNHPAADVSSAGGDRQPRAKKENPPPCWICSKANEDETTSCLHCDEDAPRAHIKCIIDRARTKNEEDYCNFEKEMAGIDVEGQSLAQKYNSLRSTLGDPWLNCSCGEKYQGSTQKLLADEFFKCYLNRGCDDIRKCFATIALVRSEFSALERKGNRSDQPYKRLKLLEEEIIDLQCCTTKVAELFTLFWSEIKKDVIQCLVVAEFYLPTKKAPKPPDACCWICLDDEPDEEGEPLVRTCACRGEGGYCHINCIVKYALQKNNATMQKLMVGNLLTKDEGNQQIASPWTQCPTCNQEYTGEFAFRLAGYFAMMYEKFPYNEFRRLSSIDTLASVSLQQSYYDVGIGLLTKHVNSIRTMQKEIRNGDGKTHLKHWLAAPSDRDDSKLQEIEQQLLNDEVKYLMYLYAFHKAKGEQKQANECLREMKVKGVEHMDLAGECGGETNPSLHVLIDDLLNGVKVSPGEGVQRTKTLVQKTKEKYGADSMDVLKLKFTLAKHLLEEGKLGEGLPLMFEVVGDSKRLLGPEHPQTVEYTKWATMMSKAGLSSTRESSIIQPRTTAKLISEVSALNEERVKAIRYTKDRQKLIVDFLEPKPGKPKRVKVTPDQLVFDNQTVVVMPNKKFGLITGFDMETKKYTLMPHGEMSVERYTAMELVVVFQPFDVQRGTLVGG